ncbi:MAG: alkaline phosphatase D family protein [Planctomycetota bacterium]|jgi:phosphodiesterase/alkaline phosphatase D-like protein
MVILKLVRGNCLAFSTFLVLVLAVRSYGGDSFVLDWVGVPDRVWVGPDCWGDRLQDWQVKGGRLECVEGSPKKPMRAVHLLTHVLGESEGSFKMRVRTGPLESGVKYKEETWSGFLIGVGGKDVDYRLSSLCHHWPGKDGGLIVAFDGSGKVVFRDNSQGGRYGTNRIFPTETWPVIKSTSVEGAGFTSKRIDDIELSLEAVPSGASYKLTCTAHEVNGGNLISRAVLDGVDPEQVSGNVALISHLSPKHGGGGYWFRDWRLSGSKVEIHRKRAFGPILCAQHTLSGGVLKLTAQMAPLGKDDTQTAELQIRYKRKEAWRTVAKTDLADHSYTFAFRVDGWDSSRDTQYRIVYELMAGRYFGQPVKRFYYWGGTVRAEPFGRDTVVVAGFTGNKHYTGTPIQWNSNAIWFPHADIVKSVSYHKPDFLFFSGDQVYEGDLTGTQSSPLSKAFLDYLDKLYRWCWVFGDLARDIPCVCIPDDHDVYHGNIWGAGGRKCKHIEEGGYRMDGVFVNMVQRTQTSHLPDPVDPDPVDQGIGVYFTKVDYGGISFAVIEDRKFKSSPRELVPKGQMSNGWPQNPDFDAALEADVPGAVLLGDRQLKFLGDWALDWSGGVEMKVLLSQTIFANVATVPEDFKTDRGTPQIPPVSADIIPGGYKLAVDADSNSWPQTGRNNALRAVRRGFTFHLAGDQHLGSLIHYGVDGWRDAGYAFCVPSIGNTWPRRWYPPAPGKNREPGSRAYTGDFRDGFGNYVTVHAVSNPVQSGHEPADLHDRAPGYGIVRLNKEQRTLTIECWPRYVDPSDTHARQYPGWPKTISQADNYGRKAAAYLPRIEVRGMKDPVFEVIDESDGEVVYGLRIKGSNYRAKVFKEGLYTVRVGEPGTQRMKVLRGIRAAKDSEGIIEVTFVE